MNIKKLCCLYDWHCWGFSLSMCVLSGEHAHTPPLFVFLPRDFSFIYDPWTALACASLQLRFVFSFLHAFHTNAKFFHNCVVFQISTIFSDSVDIFLTGYVIFQTHAIFLGNYICIIYIYMVIPCHNWWCLPTSHCSITHIHIYIYIYIYILLYSFQIVGSLVL